MIVRSIFIRSLVSLLVLVSLSSLVFADTLRLKDGSIIKGKIVGFAGGKFVVSMGQGSRQRELTFAAAEVESIEFDASGSSPQIVAASNQTPPATPKPMQGPMYEKNPRTNDEARAKPKYTNEKMPPVEWSVKVLADNTANGWTNSGWVVKKGQRIRITGEGKVSLGKGQSSPPAGLPALNDNNKLLKNVATGALVAVIGDDNNDFIYVGATREFTATRDGALFLGINEGQLEDNSGAYNVKIEIIPDEGK